MNMNKKTLAFIVSVSVILSSLLTTLVLSTSQDAFGKVIENLPGVSVATSAVDGNGKGETNPSAESKNGKEDAKLPSGLPPEFKKLVEAYSIIKGSFYDKESLDPNLLVEGAINGMIDVLKDPYTSYMDAEEMAQFEESLGSSFEGIGTEVMMQNNRVTVVSPFKDSPAEKAGLKPNDQIITVDGENIEGMDLHEAVKKIRGPKGTKVKLGILRPGLTEPITIVVTRDTIPLESVYSQAFDVNGVKIGKIQISSFSENTAERFFEEFNSLKREGIKGLVIDVRGNPGGYLEAVVGIAEELVPHKGIILQVEDREGKRVKYKSENEGDGFPIAVLIDEGSASASEILAAALKSAGYPLVGKTTFGKGTVQVPKNLKDGGSIKITIAKWLTPEGNWIHEKGVEPTLEVSQPDYFHATPILIEDKTLKRDMNSIEIQNLQKILAGLGYSLNRNDGYFDSSTENAVRSFQKKNGLAVTGVVDVKTATLLQDKLIEKIRDPQNDLQLQTALKLLADSNKNK